MKRLRGKQPDPSQQRVDEMAAAPVLPLPEPQPMDAEHHTDVGAIQPQASDHQEEQHDEAEPEHGWSLLDTRTIAGLVNRVVRDTEDTELHALTIRPLLDAVVSRAAGRLSMEDCLAARDDLVAAAMAAIPKELSKRLLQAVGKKSGDKKADAKKSLDKTPESEPQPIDSQVKQKSYLITLAGLQPDTAPDRQQMLEAVLAAFAAAGYPATALVTHAAVFQEKHCAPAGKIHYHVATSLSECVRWVPWKKELAKKGMACHFAQMAVDDHSKHRKMQYPFMLRYLFLPTRKKPLSTLDRQPVLWCANGQKHAPLMDAINGEVNAVAVEEQVTEQFLQRHARQRGPAKFSDVELWPIVKTLQVEAEDPVLLSRLLQYARDKGNMRLLNYLFRHTAQTIQDKVAMCWSLERCDQVIADAATTTWRKLTATLESPCLCDRQWAQGAREILSNNAIPEADVCRDIKHALMSGLARKQDIVCLAGSGNEGKSFLLKPLTVVYKHAARWNSCGQSIWLLCAFIFSRNFSHSHIQDNPIHLMSFFL